MRSTMRCLKTFRARYQGAGNRSEQQGSYPSLGNVVSEAEARAGISLWARNSYVRLAPPSMYITARIEFIFAGLSHVTLRRGRALLE
jgi:hypothetical protein